MFRFLPVVVQHREWDVCSQGGPKLCHMTHSRVSHHTQRHSPCVLVSGISGHLHTQGVDGGVAECRKTLRNVSHDMSCDTVSARPSCGYPILGVGQQQVENETWKLKVRAMWSNIFGQKKVWGTKSKYYKRIGQITYLRQMFGRGDPMDTLHFPTVIANRVNQ